MVMGLLAELTNTMWATAADDLQPILDCVCAGLCLSNAFWEMPERSKAIENRIFGFEVRPREQVQDNDSMFIHG